MEYLQWVLWIAGLSLQFLVLAALLAGPYKQLPILFAYSICLLVTTVVDIAVYHAIGNTHPSYYDYYWGAELVRQSGLFALVVSLVLDVMPEGNRRKLILRLIVTGAILFWVGSMTLHYNRYLNVWMTQVTRNLSFCSAIMNLVLWFILLSAEKKDLRRLMIGGGLGLQLTGEAIGQSIRQLQHSYALSLAGGMLIVLAHFLCLYIWWQALSRRSTAGPPTRPPGRDFFEGARA